MEEEIVKLATVVVTFAVAFPAIGATILPSVVQGFFIGLAVAALASAVLVYYS